MTPAGSQTLNIIIDTEGDDVLNGGDGDDLIIKSGGADEIHGNDGTDTLSLENAHFGAWVQMGAPGEGSVYADTWGWGATFDGVEIVKGTAYADHFDGSTGADTFLGGAGNDDLSGFAGNDHLEGNAGTDYLDGGDGDDLVDGGAGNDVLFTSAGNDILIGGEGHDTFIASDATQHLVMDLGAGTIANDGFGGVDSISGVETIFGSDHGNTITGSGGNDMIFGGEGGDTIVAGAGNDVLYGGGAYNGTRDTIDGGIGDDLIVGTFTEGLGNTYVGGDGADIISYGMVNVEMVIDLGLHTADGGNGIQIDHIIGFENAMGGNCDDIITGDGGGNSLWGSEGNDHLYGESGADWLSGGMGNDVLDGGADGPDTYYFDDGDSGESSVAAVMAAIGTDLISQFKSGDKFVLDDETFGLGQSALVQGSNYFEVTSFANLGASGTKGILAVNDGVDLNIYYCNDLGNVANASYQIATIQGAQTGDVDGNTFVGSSHGLG